MNLPFKINEREKKFLIYGGIIVLLIIGYNIFSWYEDMKQGVKDLSDARSMMLQKQLNKIAEKDDIQKQAVLIKREIERQEKAFLRGDKPPVAAAALQRILKDTATSLNVDVKQERTLNPVETDIYLGIPVEIGFKATTRELKDLLYKLRTSTFLLTVAEIKIRVTNISRPEDIYTTLVVTGFIKKPEEGETVGKAEKNVT